MKLFIQSLTLSVFLFFNHSSLSDCDPLSASFKPSPKDSKAYGFSSRNPSAVQGGAEKFLASHLLVLDLRNRQAECILPLSASSSHLAPSLIGVKSPSEMAQWVDWKLPVCGEQDKARLASLAPKMVKARPEAVAVSPGAVTKIFESVGSAVACGGLVVYGEEAFKTKDPTPMNEAGVAGLAAGTYFYGRGLKEIAIGNENYSTFAAEDANLEAKINEANTSLQTFEEKRGNIQMQQNQLQATIDQTNQRIAEKRHVLQNYEGLSDEARTRLSDDIVQLREEISQAEIEVKNNTAKVKGLSSDIDLTNNEIRKVKGQLSGLQAEKQALEGKIKTASSRIAKGARNMVVPTVACGGAGLAVAYFDLVDVKETVKKGWDYLKGFAP